MKIVAVWLYATFINEGVAFNSQNYSPYPKRYDTMALCLEAQIKAEELTTSGRVRFYCIPEVE